MNAHSKPEIVIRITLFEPLHLMDPHSPSMKQLLKPGEYEAELLSVPREGREEVDWFIFPEHGNKGLAVHAFQGHEKRNAVLVEQKTAGDWEEFFQ